MKMQGPYKLLFLLALVVLSACGKSNYQTQTQGADATANQYVTTKPKVDIVFFQDDSDSVIYGPFGTIKAQLQNFANNLDANVDYRFVVLPLLWQQGLGGKLVLATDCTTLAGVNCLSASQAGYFNSMTNNSSWLYTSSANNSSDYGLRNMQSNLQNLGGFLRNDASTVVVMFTNGNDVEDAYPCTLVDGRQSTCYGDSNLKNHANYLANFKGTAGLQVFPVISMNGGNCYGQPSYAGSQYMKFSNYLASIRAGSSQYYNLCDNQLGNVLNSIFSRLQTMVQAVVFNYVVIQTQPLVSSIKVTKNGVALPQSTTNGWSYEGYKTNSPTSYSPSLGNNKTGYFIKLNGAAAEYKGSDRISVDYTTP